MICRMLFWTCLCVTGRRNKPFPSAMIFFIILWLFKLFGTFLFSVFINIYWTSTQKYRSIVMQLCFIERCNTQESQILPGEVSRTDLKTQSEATTDPSVCINQSNMSWWDQTTVCLHSALYLWGCLPVLEAVGDQLSFGQVIEPSQLPAAVSAGVKCREALIASLQLHRNRDREESSERWFSNWGPRTFRGHGEGLSEVPS